MKEWIHRVAAPSAIYLAVGALPGYATVYLSVDQAQKACFPEADAWLAFDVSLSPGQVKVIEKNSGVRVRSPKPKIWRAKKGIQFLGWFIQDEVLGKHEYITWALALEADGVVKQVEVLDYRENYGAEIRTETWRAQFRGKKPGAKLQLDDDIKNISGATLSCRHLTDGVKRLLALYDLVLKQ